MSKLERYGIQETIKPMADGHWTPWKPANRKLEQALARIEELTGAIEDIIHCDPHDEGKMIDKAGELLDKRDAFESATPDPMDAPLPCDVKIGKGMTFKKGVALRTLVKAAERWHADAMKQFGHIDKNEISRLLHKPGTEES